MGEGTGAFISSAVCLVAPGGGFSHTLHLFTHHLVTEMCAKTPPMSRHESGVGGASTNERTKEKPGARKEAFV